MKSDIEPKKINVPLAYLSSKRKDAIHGGLQNSRET